METAVSMMNHPCIAWLSTFNSSVELNTGVISAAIVVSCITGQLCL